MTHRNHPWPPEAVPRYLWRRCGPGSWALVRRVRTYEHAGGLAGRWARALGVPQSDFVVAMTPPHDPEA